MNTWICRILMFVFLANCLPVQTWAEYPRSSKHKRSLHQQVAQQVTQAPYDQWKQEAAELEKILQEGDLTPDERRFAQLELDSAKTHIEFMDTLETAEAMSEISFLNSLYGARQKVIEVQEKDLEKKAQIRQFYQTAQSNKMIAAAVYALHQHPKDSQARLSAAQATSDRLSAQYKAKYTSPQQATSRRAQLRQQPPQGNLDYLTQRPDAMRVAAQPAQPKVTSKFYSTILDRWAKNEISVEELAEYTDPTSDMDASVNDIAAAAELLFYIYYGYNSPKEELNKDTLANAIWLAKRLKYRTQHQLHVLEQQAKANNALDFVQARGNVMRLSIQIRNFLNKNVKDENQAMLVELDQQLPEYADIRSMLAGFRENMWSYSSVAQALAEDVKKSLQNKPNPDDEAATVLIQKLAYVTSYLVATGNTGRLADIFLAVNGDKETFHGKNEQYVNTVFGSIFDTMISYTLSAKTQNDVRKLLVCAAAPLCKYGDYEKTNAVNVRVQALAVGSMLRQVAKTHTIPPAKPFDKPEEVTVTLQKEIFGDPSFRQKMAGFAMDIYGPTQAWNTQTLKRYGLGLDELQELGDYLARIFESFLPVMEPEATIKPITQGPYKHCWTREINVKHLVALTGLQTSSHFVQPATGEAGYPCTEVAEARWYGGLSTIIVTNSSGHLLGLTRFNPYNRKQAFEDLGASLLTEVATWYLWGAAFKGLGYLWKGVRVASVAAKAATKASSGFRLARFNSKFTQVWKLSTQGWQTEMGIVNVTQNGKKILVEMHRPGYQGLKMELSEAVLKGNSLKTLKGRILLRRAMQTNIYANVGKTAQAMNITAATKGTRLLGTVTDDLAQELTRPLTKVEQAVVRGEEPLVRATEVELAKENSVEVISRTTEKGAQASLYRPIPAPKPYINLGTGLPERVVLNPFTGNLAGEVSGQYAGTVVTPFTKDVLAYNMAAGLTKFPSSRFAGRLLWNQFPVLDEMKGLSTFVMTMTALDQPIYHWYTKPYLEDFAKRQDKYLTQATGFDPKAQEETPATKTLLDGVQGLTTHMDNTAGASMQGIFMGANQALNYILPDPIQMARQWLFKKTVEISSAIDDPIAEQIGAQSANFLPLPGQLASFPFVLAGDPTPTYSEAAKAQYAVQAREQALSKAMEQHGVSSFQQQLDQEIKAVETGLPFVLKENAVFLSALPQAEKELKRAYKTYGQALKAARHLATKDLEQAGKNFEDAARKFTNTQADIMTRAVTAYVAQEKAQAAAMINQTRENLSATLVLHPQDPNLFYFDEQNAAPNVFIFTKQDEERYTQLYSNYYTQYQADLIAFFTSNKTALETKQSPLELQTKAQEALQQHDLAFAATRDSMEQELNKRLELVKTISEEWQRDYMNMCPALLKQFPSESQLRVQQIFDEFLSGLKTALHEVNNSAALQETYNQLVKIRDTRFANVKQYLIELDPGYEPYFRYTLQQQLLLLESAQQAAPQAE